MTKPSTVKIGAHRYTVSYHDVLYDSGEMQEYLGRCDYAELEMSVKQGRAGGQMAETFLHEAIHAISNDRMLEMDERQVDQVANGVLALIVDNPALFGDTFTNLWEVDMCKKGTRKPRRGGRGK